jgi:hypothetical protein
MNLLGLYRRFGVVPQGFVVLFPIVLGGDFRCPLLVVFSVCFRDLALGIWWGKFVSTLRGSFAFDSLPNPRVKGLDFGVFGVLGLEVFLSGFLRFLLIWQILVDKIMASGASHLWDLPWVNCLTCVLLGLGAAGQFLVCLGLFC